MQFQQTLWRLDIIPLSGNLKPPLLWMPKSNCRRKSQSGKDLIISRSIGQRHKHNSRVLFIIQTSYIDDLILDTVITGSQLHPPISSPQRYFGSKSASTKDYRFRRYIYWHTIHCSVNSNKTDVRYPSGKPIGYLPVG